MKYGKLLEIMILFAPSFSVYIYITKTYIEYIGSNECGDEGISAIGNMLKSNTSLEALELCKFTFYISTV